jgi:hypothetical protein
MARKARLKGQIDDLRRGVKRAAEAARAGAEGTGREGGRNVNVAGRANVVVSRNAGEAGSSREATSTQKVRIRQDGDEAYEEVETTRSPHQPRSSE